MSSSSKFLSNPFSRHKSKGAAPTPPLPSSSHGSTTSTVPASTSSGTQPVNPQAPPVPARNEALEKAIQVYISKLSADDKAAFQSAPDIIERLQEMQNNDKSLVSSSTTARVEKVLQCVKHFMASVGIFIQQSPEISSLVVGGVNCVLTVSIFLDTGVQNLVLMYVYLAIGQLVLGYIEFFGRLTEMMERLGAHLSYLTEYSKGAFQNSVKLQNVR